MRAAFLAPVPLGRYLSSARIGQRYAALPLSGKILLRPGRKAAHMSIADAPDTSRVAVGQSASSRNFSWTERWFPILFEEDFDASVPYAFTIWERNLVMYRDEAGKYVVMNDVCTHRAAPLSEGRITTSKTGKTVLECPYHGWAFDCTGSCVCIPQLKEEQKIPSAANMKRVYDTCVQNGTIYVWLGEPGEGKGVEIPDTGREFDRSTFRKVINYDKYVRTVAYDALTLSENLIDPEHVKWAHHGVQPGFDRTIPSQDVDFRLKDMDEHSGTFTWAYTSKPSSDRRPAPDFDLTLRGGLDITYQVTFPNIGVAHTWFFAVPISRDQTKLIMKATAFLYKPTWLFRLIELRRVWLQHWRQHLILDSDMYLLHAQQRFLEKTAAESGTQSWKRNYVLAAGTLDAAVISFRRWLDDHIASIPYSTVGGSVGRPDASSKEYMIERYESHTKHCKACGDAMKNMQRLRVVATGLAAACAVFFVSSIAAVRARVAAVTMVGASQTTGAILRPVSFPTRYKALVAASGGLSVLACIVVVLLSTWIQRFVRTERAYAITRGD